MAQTQVQAIKRVCPNGHGELEERETSWACLKCSYELTKPKKRAESKHANMIPQKIRDKVEEALSDIKIDLFSKQVEGSLVPWKQERWMLIPRKNYSSGREYTGWNRLLLWSHPDDLFITRKKVIEMGGSLKPDVHPVYVVGWFPIQKKKDETQEQFLERTRFRKFMSMLIEVIPFSDTIGIPKKAAVTSNNKRNETIEAFVERIVKKGLILKEQGQEAFYNYGKDFLQIPALEKFVSSDMYYKSLFHELIHWTGADSRCNRELCQERSKYGREELVAEIGSAALCHMFNIDMGTDSTEYINDWLTAISEDISILLEASTRAEKAIDFLMAEDKPLPKVKAKKDFIKAQA